MFVEILNCFVWLLSLCGCTGLPFAHICSAKVPIDKFLSFEKESFQLYHIGWHTETV